MPLSPDRILTRTFDDDGVVPNNSALPLVVYRGAFQPVATGQASDDQGFAPIMAARFAANGWRGVWTDGIYTFHHYHACSHEVLGIARGTCRVVFGGRNGELMTLEAGDVVVIPAGVGHCRVDTNRGLLVVGAYPAGQEAWDLKRATPADRAQALAEIPAVALPTRDPVTGAKAPLLELWR